MHKLIITNHSLTSISEKAGFKKKSIARILDKVLEKGIKHNQTTGRLRKYLDFLYLTHKTSNNTRIYGHNVYLINKNVLITIIPLPKEYHSAVDKILKKTKT